MGIFCKCTNRLKVYLLLSIYSWHRLWGCWTRRWLSFLSCLFSSISTNWKRLEKIHEFFCTVELITNRPFFRPALVEIDILSPRIINGHVDNPQLSSRNNKRFESFVSTRSSQIFDTLLSRTNVSTNSPVYICNIQICVAESNLYFMNIGVLVKFIVTLEY